ncbi:DsbA family oxidoreductase [Vulgatibacter sp.]|uniref:DsbA family oxidoreductase n=1 Tax=Vulgatibacter sp. TaxID=1971226 RepID=UPI0035681164
MSLEKRPLRVDVISDAVCPWCWIGKRRLEAAIRQCADRYAVAVHWHPFELNPDLPKDGVDARTHYERKFGSIERVRQLRANVAAVGREAGIDFDFERAEKAPNTFDSHRLVWLAAGTGFQGAVVERLFRAFFVEGQDVGDHRVLVRLAEEAGLDPHDVEHVLASEAGAAEVRGAEEAVRRLGVSSVPFFVVEGQWAISGAQPVDAFVQLLDHAAQQIAAQATPRA